jgi:hypothetical protein
VSNGIEETPRRYINTHLCLFKIVLEQARNLKVILCLFEQMLGLKINFHINNIYCLGDALGRERDRVALKESLPANLAHYP